MVLWSLACVRQACGVACNNENRQIDQNSIATSALSQYNKPMPNFITRIPVRFRFPLVLAALALLYLALRLFHLTLLPVFADEAIYIYWSQLTASDAARFLFYPLQDGKTPLFIWAMIPFLRLIADPLFAARLVSVIFGLAQMWLTGATIALFTPRRRYQLLGAILVIFLPGFILNQRLALMDTMMTFFLTASFYASYRGLILYHRRSTWMPATTAIWRWWFIGGFSFGLALLTKFSGLLFLLPLASLCLYFPRSLRRLCRSLAFLATSALLGLLLLLTLKISPMFSQLLARGSDFLYLSLSQLIHHPFSTLYTYFTQQNFVSIVTGNFSFFAQVLANYLTLPLILFTIILIIFTARCRRFAASKLFLSGVLFLLPLLFFGHVLYPRYLMPILPFFVISFVVSLAHLPPLRLHRLFLSCLLILIFTIGVNFTFANLFNPPTMDLTSGDYAQFFTTWSAGYGILPTVELLEDLAQNQPTLVLTEGHIGTLPDGLQIYFFRRSSRNNLRIEGIGQPVRNFNDVQDLIAAYPQAVLVVNSSRLMLDDGIDLTLLANYPRPTPDAPTLQVYRIK
jgi:4-amino-4-deoxy-L-arabinose transferase-like glycosyltransferase